MKIKIDCHLHTNRYSPCSSLSPVRACELAIHRGLDALVITEHQIQWSPQEIRELQTMFPKIKLFAGLEVTLEEGFDIVIITRNQSLNIPYGLPLQDVNSILGDSTQFTFLAHAFRWTDKISKELLAVARIVQGMEVNSINILHQQFQTKEGKYIPKRKKLYDLIQKKLTLTPLYNSDAHQEQSIGTFANCIEVKEMPGDESELARILGSAQIKEVQNPKLLARLL